jgi:outer membrane biosynthesis protein TonB
MSDYEPALRGRPRSRSGNGLAFAGTALIHGAAVGMLFADPSGGPDFTPPIYTVQLIAAPRPQPNARRAPQVIERPAQRSQPAAQRATPSVAEAPPPPDPEMEREPAPRSTPDVELVPDEEPSTGDDPATVSVSGVTFPFPEYLRNIVSQVYRRWQRPSGNQSRRAEILFFVRRDGSITNLQFVTRSGSFRFDLEAEGAIESAASSGTFGPLPDGFPGDILPVSFFFDPSIGRR